MEKTPLFGSCWTFVAALLLASLPQTARAQHGHHGGGHHHGGGFHHGHGHYHGGGFYQGGGYVGNYFPSYGVGYAAARCYYPRSLACYPSFAPGYSYGSLYAYQPYFYSYYSYGPSYLYGPGYFRPYFRAYSPRFRYGYYIGDSGLRASSSLVMREPFDRLRGSIDRMDRLTSFEMSDGSDLLTIDDVMSPVERVSLQHNAVRALQSGDAAFQGKRYANAAEFYRIATEEAPRDAHTYLRAGYALVALNRYRDAYGMFAKGLHSADDKLFRELSLDELYVDDAEKAEHLDQLAKAALDDPTNSQLPALIGVFLVHNGNRDRAAKFFEESQRLSKGREPISARLFTVKRHVAASPVPVKDAQALR